MDQRHGIKTRSQGEEKAIVAAVVAVILGGGGKLFGWLLGEYVFTSMGAWPVFGIGVAIAFVVLIMGVIILLALVAACLPQEAP